jgi:hypothetical protein
MAQTNEVALQRCLCCGVTWESKHSRGPLLCGLCYQSLSSMAGASSESKCNEHGNWVNAIDVCPSATFTNGAYVPVVAR